MEPKSEKILIYAPQPNATPDEIMQVLKLVMFQSYPTMYKTQERLESLYNHLPEGARRHFKLQEKATL